MNTRNKAVAVLGPQSLSISIPTIAGLYHSYLMVCELSYVVFFSVTGCNTFVTNKTCGLNVIDEYKLQLPSVGRYIR